MGAMTDATRARPEDTVRTDSRPNASLITAVPDPILSVENLSLDYGEKRALENVSFDIPRTKITAFIGPSGCGKSTLLRCINRLNDLIEGVRIEGDLRLEGNSIYDPSVDTTELRKKIGMVFQKSNPFPKSIYENIAYGCRIHGISSKHDLDEIVEHSLRGSALWDDMQQASRVSDYTAFLYLGRLIEYQDTDRLFLNPGSKQTEDYITGRFG